MSLSDFILPFLAFAAYFGIRAYNLSHKYKASPLEKGKEGAKATWQWVGGYNLGKKTINVVDSLKSELLPFMKMRHGIKRGWPMKRDNDIFMPFVVHSVLQNFCFHLSWI